MLGDRTCTWRRWPKSYAARYRRGGLYTARRPSGTGPRSSGIGRVGAVHRCRASGACGAGFIASVHSRVRPPAHSFVDRMAAGHQVHAHYWMSGLASMEAAEAVRVPLVQTFHALGVTKVRNQGVADTSPGTGRGRVRSERSRHRYLRSWRRVNASSWSYAAAEHGRARRQWSHVALTRLASRQSPSPARADSTGRIVSVGRLVERKGVDDVVHTLLGLPDTHLVIAGGTTNGDDADEEALAEGRGES